MHSVRLKQTVLFTGVTISLVPMASAQSAGSSAAASAISLTPASTFVTMNPAMFGGQMRSGFGAHIAHKPQWRTAGGSFNIGDLRIAAGKGSFLFAPALKESFVGIDFAHRLATVAAGPHINFTLGADASVGYGAIEFPNGGGEVGQTTGLFLAGAMALRLSELSVIPYWAPGYFSGRYTRVFGNLRFAQSGRRLTKGGGVRVELAGRLGFEAAVRRTMIEGSVPRYGMAVWYTAPVLPSGATSGVNNLRLEMDNDYYAFWYPPDQRPDADYTNGLRISFDRSRPIGALARLTSELPSCSAENVAPRCALARIELGQEIYTPTDDTFLHLKYDRPFAGWLYAAYFGHSMSERQDRTIGLKIGATGAPSLAEGVQTAFHALFPWYRQTIDWNSQLSFEPGVIGSYERRYLIGGYSDASDYLQVAPEWKISAGNILTGASAGGSIRVGYHLLHPWLPSARRPQPRLSIYLFGGSHQDLVLHDLFLDGNTFRGQRQVQRIPWVAQGEWGGGLKLGYVVAEYRAVIRQREYRVKKVCPDDVGRPLTSPPTPPPSCISPLVPIINIPKFHPYGALSLTVQRAF